MHLNIVNYLKNYSLISLMNIIDKTLHYYHLNTKYGNFDGWKNAYKNVLVDCKQPLKTLYTVKPVIMGSAYAMSSWAKQLIPASHATTYLRNRLHSHTIILTYVPEWVRTWHRVWASQNTSWPISGSTQRIKFP